MTTQPAPHDTLLTDVRSALASRSDWSSVVQLCIRHLRAESGTLHLLGADGHLHLAGHGPGLPEPVLKTIQVIPVGKGMAGLAVERRAPVDACNIQTDESGDVRPGAKATGLQGAIVVPVWKGARVVGALGVANRAERTFTPAEIAALTEAGRLIGGAAP